MFKKILIANRGEIACRVIRTCRRLGIPTVAVYSEADRRSQHVLLADESVCIGAPESAASYLSVDKIVAAAKSTAAEAIHPGYGFLSENEDFARALAAAGLTFIGPSPEVMEQLGDKVAAKKLAATCKVPLVPGLIFKSQEAKKMESEAKAFTKDHGFPVMIKAAAGGGGRGMRRVQSAAELADALAAASREAQAAFGSGELFIEKLVEHARHVEVQILGDGCGNVFSLFDRDCSMQRHHQKVIEEAPAPALPPEVRARIHEAARTLCKRAGYQNAGTVEFLVAPSGEFYFLEVNSRLQVEHPVTEAITGLDLVELQIRAAAGEDLSPVLGESSLRESGAAIELRLCAESPEDGFVASTGRLDVFDIPLLSSGGASIRVDSGFQVGDRVTHYYDSLLAKIIVHAPTRAEAISAARSLLAEAMVAGIRTNIGFLRALLASAEFQEVRHHTTFAVSKLPKDAERSERDLMSAALAVLLRDTSQRNEDTDPWQQSSGFRIFGAASTKVHARVNGHVVVASLQQNDTDSYELDCGDHRISLGFERRAGDQILLRSSIGTGIVQLASAGGAHWVRTPWGMSEVREELPRLKQSEKGAAAHSGLISSPLPGKIMVVKTKAGASVQAGDPLLVIESMKMEHVIRSPHEGTVKQIHVRDGEVVEANAVLAELQFAS